ncbi:MAG: hypothetical protein QXO51_03605 [Halobacteria archaeon]
MGSENWLKEATSAVARHLSLMLELAKGEGTVTDVARRMGKKPPQVTMWSQRLEKVGLVERRPGEGPRKILRLSERGRGLLDFLAAMGPRTRPAPPPSLELVLTYLRATDPSLDFEARKGLAKAFSELAYEYEVEDYPQVRAVFTSLVRTPARGDVERGLWDAFRHAMPRMVRDPAAKKWVMKTLYGSMVEAAKNAGLDGELRADLLVLFRHIFQQVPESRDDLLEMAKAILLEKGKTSALHREAWQILLMAPLMGEAKAGEILGWVLQKANGKDADERLRDQGFLPQMIEVFRPKAPRGA